MGDRGNIKVMSRGGEVWFYTHWRGSEMWGVVATALERGRDRWNDGPHLARIIFDDLTDGDRDTTGFGISSGPGDNEHPYVVVDVDKQTVYEENEDAANKRGCKKPVPFATLAQKHPAASEAP